MVSEETPRGLTRGSRVRPGKKPGPTARRCGGGSSGEEDRGGREEETRQSEAAGRSAERQVVGKPETGTSAEGGRTWSLTGGRGGRSVSRARRPVGIGGQSPRDRDVKIRRAAEDQNRLETLTQCGAPRQGRSWVSAAC